MNDIREITESISVIVDDITNTARYVNSDSHKRKSITSESLSLIEKLINECGILQSEFGEILDNLNASLISIDNNLNEIKYNIKHFSEIISNLNVVKGTLNNLNNEIDTLTNIIEEIKNDTDDIFLLAVNASIESSKYSHNAKVFDVLANKLNRMSDFINQNIASIVDVVDPIIEGIQLLIRENSIIIDDIKEGNKSIIEFTSILDKQRNAIHELLSKANLFGTKIDDQKKMLDDINKKVHQMDVDATGAIAGSGNVINVGEDLSNKIQEVISIYNSGNNFLDKIDFIRDQSSSVWQTAQNVNERSKSQLEFSLSCVAFCDSIITESVELQKMTKTIKEHSANSNNMANLLSQSLGQLNSQLNEIESKIIDSDKTIQKFNEDYDKINNIINFLKNIFRSMKIIGMYSRIESSRDPTEFAGFTTIYKNINTLQSQIQRNIPKIEENINNTHRLIENTNSNFKNISSVFYTLSNSTNSLIKELRDITQISADSEEISQSIVNESNKIDSSLNELRNFLLELTEVVKKPIEGSAANIERGKVIEKKCQEIKELAVHQTSNEILQNDYS